MKQLVEEVFVTEGLPQFTFVKPPNFNEILLDIRNPGKPVIVEGQSGTGKSSLINYVTGLTLTTGILTKKTLKGGHTTTSTQLIPLAFGGFCVDTPGIRSFGLVSLTREDVRDHFTEFHPFSCRYPDCTHQNEPGCGVQEALMAGKIAPFRFESYLKLIDLVQ